MSRERRREKESEALTPLLQLLLQCALRVLALQLQLLPLLLLLLPCALHVLAVLMDSRSTGADAQDELLDVDGRREWALVEVRARGAPPQVGREELDKHSK